MPSTLNSLFVISSPFALEYTLLPFAVLLNVFFAMAPLFFAKYFLPSTVKVVLTASVPSAFA